ncbi:MAG: GNAT family N-acetyltransferase [Phycisphaeraceae bacterium]
MSTDPNPRPPRPVKPLHAGAKQSEAPDGSPAVHVRQTRPGDVDAIVEMCRLVYRHTRPWHRDELLHHQEVFPEGQLVAVETASNKVVGMAASLIVVWDDYDTTDTWLDFTGRGTFDTHDPAGRTLYGAEVMVHPEHQGEGVGKALYAARRELCRRLGLLRIRAGARLRGYHRYADQLSPRQYVRKVLAGELGDPTLTFQLKQGFRVLAVVSDYLGHDPDSRGNAALIEWVNDEVARPEDVAGQGRAFTRQLESEQQGDRGS